MTAAGIVRSFNWRIQATTETTILPDRRVSARLVDTGEFWIESKRTVGKYICDTRLTNY